MIEIRLRDLTKTCESCPTQWEGQATDGRPVYIRYRWGWLSVSIAEIGGNPVGQGDVVSLQIGDDLDGTLSDEKLRESVNANSQTVLITA